MQSQVKVKATRNHENQEDSKISPIISGRNMDGPANTLILEIFTLEIWENKFVLRQQAYGSLSQKPWETNTENYDQNKNRDNRNKNS